MIHVGKVVFPVIDAKPETDAPANQKAASSTFVQNVRHMVSDGGTYVMDGGCVDQTTKTTE